MTSNESHDARPLQDAERPVDTDDVAVEETYPHGAADENEAFEPTDPLLQGGWSDRLLDEVNVSDDQAPLDEPEGSENPSDEGSDLDRSEGD